MISMTGEFAAGLVVRAADDVDHLLASEPTVADEWQELHERGIERRGQQRDDEHRIGCDGQAVQVEARARAADHGPERDDQGRRGEDRGLWEQTGFGGSTARHGATRELAIVCFAAVRVCEDAVRVRKRFARGAALDSVDAFAIGEAYVFDGRVGFDAEHFVVREVSFGCCFGAFGHLRDEVACGEVRQVRDEDRRNDKRHFRRHEHECEHR
ncbi:MAG: hypothetical protein WEB52_14385 [Dehalococcoidia bacterium]